MENTQVTLKAGAISTAEVTIMAVAGAAPVMCIGGSLHSLLGLTGTGVSLSVAIATLLCVFIGLSYGDLSRKYNCCGGTYSYIANVFGVKAGLWTAFVYYGVMFTTSACPPTIFATYLNSLTGLPGWVGWAIFAAICAIITWFGIGLSTKATVVVFIVEMVLMLIPAINLLSLNPNEFLFATSMENAFVPGNGLNGLFLAVLVWIWAFVGIEAPSFMGEELKDGWKGVKFAIPMSALITGIIYVVCCWLWTASLSPDQIEILAGSSDALAAYCNLFNYAAGSTMVCLAVMIAAIACGLAMYTMAIRFMYDQGRIGLLPKGTTKLNKHQIPWVTTIIYTVISFIFTMYGLYAYGGIFDGINDHFTVMGIMATTTWSLICIGNIKERWHDKGFGAFFTAKVFPIISVLFIAYTIIFTTGAKYLILTGAWYLIALILAFALSKRVKLQDLAQ